MRRDLAAGARVRLVVIELGAWGLVSHVAPDGCDHTVVIAQVRGESPAELCSRALRRLRSLERSSERVGRAILLLAPRSDSEASVARATLARALVQHDIAPELVRDVSASEAADDRRRVA